MEPAPEGRGSVVWNTRSSSASIKANWRPDWDTWGSVQKKMKKGEKKTKKNNPLAKYSQEKSQCKAWFPSTLSLNYGFLRSEALTLNVSNLAITMLYNQHQLWEIKMEKLFSWLIKSYFKGTQSNNLPIYFSDMQEKGFHQKRWMQLIIVKLHQSIKIMQFIFLSL